MFEDSTTEMLNIILSLLRQGVRKNDSARRCVPSDCGHGAVGAVGRCCDQQTSAVGFHPLNEGAVLASAPPVQCVH